MADKILLNDTFNCRIGVETSEKNKVYVGATILVKHCERLGRHNCRDATVTIDSQEALVLLVVADMRHVVNDAKELIVIVRCVIDVVEFLQHFSVIEVRTDARLFKGFVGVGL